jgi:molybdenum cofactor cytidylyltransferase
VPGPVGVVVLAAGGGSRFRGPEHKLTAPLRNRPVVVWALEAAAAAGIGPLIVVTGALPLDPTWLPHRARPVFNPHWAQGQATSLQRAVTIARELGWSAMVVGLGDQPFIQPDAWRLVAASPVPIAVATYEGTRGNPVRLAAPVWELLAASGDTGARSLMANRPELVAEVPCPGDAADIDTLEDLARWNS